MCLLVVFQPNITLFIMLSATVVLSDTKFRHLLCDLDSPPNTLLRCKYRPLTVAGKTYERSQLDCWQNWTKATQGTIFSINNGKFSFFVQNLHFSDHFQTTKNLDLGHFGVWKHDFWHFLDSCREFIKKLVLLN